MSEPHVVVVGGGLAGLTAAAVLARHGRAVTLFESGEQLGGRGRSRHRDGFDLNIGPHAVYRAGAGHYILRQLGVDVRGRAPKLRRGGVLIGDEVRPMLGAVLRNRRRLRTLQASRGLAQRAAATWSGRPATEWLDDVAGDDPARQFLESVVRTSTYTADHSLLDAGDVGRQMRLASRGVLYIDGGWSSLVDGLAAVIRSHGGEIRLGSPVAAVEHDSQVRAVRLRDGSTVGADAVVVAAADARRVAALLDGPGQERVAAATAAVVPVRMAHLDVALRPLPHDRFPNVFGLDEPVYLTVPSDVAAVAPTDGAVISVGRYLTPGEETGEHRASLERVLDIAQPGWRDHVVDARYTPHSMVSGDHARWATGGVAGRVRADAAGVPGLAIAGDWVGPVGMLADASIAAGKAAAESALAAVADSSPTVRM